MEEQKRSPLQKQGNVSERQLPCRKCGAYHRWITVGVLLCWDGLLLYMILRCLVHPVYGAVLVACVSVYLGYEM